MFFAGMALMPARSVCVIQRIALYREDGQSVMADDSRSSPMTCGVSADAAMMATCCFWFLVQDVQWLLR
jgi:hypothetical protein